MKWTVLSDNQTNYPMLQTEHGLSILLRTERHKILLDTGASDVFIRNAERLGIDLGDIDYVFISHGHSDHAGGLRYFLEHNQQAKIIVSPDAMSGQFFSKRGHPHSIKTEWPEIERYRLITIDRACELTDGLFVIAHIPHVYPMPKGNQNLFIKETNGEYIPDDFRHELALYTDGLLFTGCAHSGLENILSACTLPVHTVVGGFHLLDGYETEEKQRALAQRLKTNYPATHFYTSHCTGSGVFAAMKSVMGEQLKTFGIGTEIAHPIAKDIIAYMESLRNEEQRQQLMRFFKTDKGQYAEGDEFLGLKVPQTRKIVKQSEDVPLGDVPQLLTCHWHEVRLCGLLLLVSKFEKLTRHNLVDDADAIKARDEIVKMYLDYADCANNWDLVDMSAPRIIGSWLLLPTCLGDHQAIVDKLADSGNLWRERISMVCTWMTSRKGDASWCLRYAGKHLRHTHDLMHKAVGWMLREMGKQVSMDLLRDFLRQHVGEMPRTTLRYAIEKMTEEERRYWMKKE